MKILELEGACSIQGHRWAPCARFHSRSQLRHLCTLGFGAMQPFWGKGDWHWVLQFFKPSLEIENIVVLEGNKIWFQSTHIFINVSWKTCNYTTESQEERVKDAIAECCKTWCIGWDIEICIHFLSGNDGLIFCKINDNASLHKRHKLFSRTSRGMLYAE